MLRCLRLIGWSSLAILQLCVSALAAETTVMRVGTILQIQPDHPTVLLMQQAYAELGIHMQLELLPTERALVELNRGKLLDANLAATRVFESHNPKLVRVPVPVYQLEFAIFSTEPGLNLSQWSQLAPYPVVMIQGMVAVKQQLEQNSGQQVVAVMSMEQALQQLELGRNKLAVLPKFEAEAMLKKLQLKNVQVLAPSLMVTSAYHYVHQRHQALVAPLSKVLSRLTGQQIEPEPATRSDQSAQMQRLDKEDASTGRQAER